MNKYQQFIFKDYRFDEVSKLLRLTYGYDETLEFNEDYKFDFGFTDYDPAQLDRAIQLLFFVAGVSYYKAYLADKIDIRKGEVDKILSDYLGRTYQKGLGEFFHTNNLDPLTKVTFPVNSSTIEQISKGNKAGILIGLGGGKDSLVTSELLRDQPKVASWSLNHRSQLEPLVQKVGLPHFWVEREWDSQLQQLNIEDALNGHVPISAIFSCVGNIVALLSGYRDNVVSNESSASEPTLHYQNVAINHQYSKSLDYEKDFQEILQHLFGEDLRYYSYLRPFSELRIAELFAELGFEKYQDVFGSCNRAYTHDQHNVFWCGQCPKCAFVFLILTPFIKRERLEAIWAKNLLLDPSLEITYTQLLGIAGDKPFDCVGEVKESRAAMRLASQIYPELSKYKFEIPEDYDFRAWSEHLIPAEMFSKLKDKVLT